MKLIKVFLSVAIVGSMSACSENNFIYGSWSGMSNGDNSYSKIDDEAQDATTIPDKQPLSYSRSVDLTLTIDDCKIVFDSRFDDPVDCVYKSDEKAIFIPLWRNEDSIYDTGLMITKLDEATLELENRFTRVFTDTSNNFDHRYEMKGTEFYHLSKND